MDEKGISPLIAAVLLIAFVVAIGTITMGWLSTTARNTTETIGTKTETVVGCSDASLEIEHVYVSGSTDKIVVKNTGFKDLTVVGYVYSTTGTECKNETGMSLATGEIKDLVLGTGTCPTGTSTFKEAIATATNCGGITDTLTDTTYVS